MNERIRKHFDRLFEDAPKTKRVAELKEEMVQNAVEKYCDLISGGVSDEEAFQNVISSVGDVEELFEELDEDRAWRPSKADMKKKAMLTAVAAGLYIFAGVVFFCAAALDEIFYLSDNASTVGLVLAIAICIAPTCMLVYLANMYPNYEKKEETMVENYKEFCSGGAKSKAVKNAVNTIIWMVVLALYFAISFATYAWHVTWVLFLIGACAQAVAELVFAFSNKE